MEIQVGDRVTYKDYSDEKIYEILITAEIDKKLFEKHTDLEILKIERPKYEVIEEKKELLTEEEREYLRNVIEPIKFRIMKIMITPFYIKFLEIDDTWDCLSLGRLKFEGLNEGKKYSLSELRIGGTIWKLK